MTGRVLIWEPVQSCLSMRNCDRDRTRLGDFVGQSKRGQFVQVVFATRSSFQEPVNQATFVGLSVFLLSSSIDRSGNFSHEATTLSSGESTSSTDSQLSSPGPVSAMNFAYKAFLSYSHKVDSKLAARLQKSLHRFAKPWYRRRMIRIFRDQTNLSANPGLWDEIRKALDQSEFYIYLASPQAAKSRWVRAEFEYWYTHRDPDKALIVLADGSLEWDQKKVISTGPKPTRFPRE